MNQIDDVARSLGQSAYERLRNMILDGTLPSGTRLQEKTFAERLGVSRTPVREAIGQLVSEGLVTRSGGGVTMVNSISLTDVMEILHLRRLLECEAARQAALSNKGVEELSALRGRIIEFLDGPRPDAETHAQLDDDLHIAIARIAGSHLLKEMIENLKLKTRIFDQGSIPDRFEPGCQEHIRIIDAIIANGPEAAEELMRTHITNAREAIIGHIHRPF
ncbi:GntR family transcriptional regulator [Candidatus Halocynthiibacter alkanivorans]|uniref:GntR family transcriptional regulator n=1 Tax=Candidatus Halocynthiibacter alkanivorans TaxID=2267619 RepID=UPI000DF20891|nr:GntR family transcriptional regulator [Candidatus Halocynthiibacter alkanivorans]